MLLFEDKLAGNCVGDGRSGLTGESGMVMGAEVVVVARRGDVVSGRGSAKRNTILGASPKKPLLGAIDKPPPPPSAAALSRTSFSSCKVLLLLLIELSYTKLRV